MQKTKHTSTKSFDDIKATISSTREVLETRFKVKTIGVFGSYVRGEQKKRSDVDILVEFSDSVGLIEFIELENYLKKLLGVKVDLVTKDALKPYIGKYILEEVVYV
ncbi:MAG: nucleotidyltransferase family protein [Nitrospirae bacterium]|nr:nucleotidyltransferase family protein [Nitrospirota bacterium]